MKKTVVTYLSYLTIVLGIGVAGAASLLAIVTYENMLACQGDGRLCLNVLPDIYSELEQVAGGIVLFVIGLTALILNRKLNHGSPTNPKRRQVLRPMTSGSRPKKMGIASSILS
jgi:hypothetical protein